MKNNWTARIAALVLIMTLVTASLVAGTYAKYTTTVTATGSVTVADWVANFDDAADPTTYTDIADFDLFGTAFSDTGVDGKLMAPGTKGSFTVHYKTSGSQVARNVKITLDASSLSDLSFLTFTVDGTPLDGTAGNMLNKNFGPTDTGDGSVTVNWEWPFDNSDDAADTADGRADITDKTVTVTFVAEQLDTAA